MSAPAESMPREEGFAHREEGPASLLREGSWCSRLGNPEPATVAPEGAGNRLTERLKRNTCLQRVFRFQPLFPSLLAGVRAAEERHRKGST